MKSLICVASLAVLCFSAGQADAAFTSVYQSSEKALYEGAIGFNSSKGNIMKEIYGPSITYMRIDDSFDKIWQNNNGGVAQIQAKYAGNSQKLSYVGATTGLQDLFSVTGNGFAGSLTVTTLGGISTTPAEQFTWKLTSPNTGSGLVFSSDSSLNSNDNFNDHMVTFKLSNGNYVIAFEDLKISTGASDKDYNDLVVEVAFGKFGSGPAVPEPATMGLFGLGTLLFGASRMRRKQA